MRKYRVAIASTNRVYVRAFVCVCHAIARGPENENSEQIAISVLSGVPVLESVYAVV